MRMKSLRHIQFSVADLEKEERIWKIRKYALAVVRRAGFTLKAIVHYPNA